MKKINLLTFIAALALLAVVTACASPASSENSETTSPVSTPAAEMTDGAGTTTTAEATETDDTTGTTPEGGATNATPAAGTTGTAEATPAAETTGTAGEDDETGPDATPTFGPEVQAWPVLLDPEYSFSVRYPTGWMIGEEDVTEEDAPLMRAYTLQPADWSEETAPVVVEVIDGDEAGFNELHPELADAETQEFAGYEGRMGQVTEGDNQGATVYAFQHPERAEWNVVIRVDDVEGGLPQDQVLQLVNSFRWGELPEVEETATPEAGS